MTGQKTAAGHLAAGVTVLLWGTTFISSKLLLDSFRPLELLFFRFLIGYAALWLACPRRMRPKQRGHEVCFLAAGLSGVTLYYLLENVALTYTFASNVGIIVSTAPFFTVLVDCVFLRGKWPGPRFYIGFLCAMGGIVLLGAGGGALRPSPTGDLLALLAAVVWAFYSAFVKKLGLYGYGGIQATRRIFFYGLLFMLPAVCFTGFRLGPERFTDPVNLFNLIYLGLGASALCFVIWNFALQLLGPVRTGVYIYVVPVVTVVVSAIILREPITETAVAGMALTLAGLFLSEGKLKLPGRKVG